jgi:hypothetical protein
LLPIPCSAEWTTADTAREAVYLGLHVADWGQTLQVAKHPDKYSEGNSLLGKKPSRSTVNRYFLLTGLGHVGVSYLLPRKAETFGIEWAPREAWQYVTIGFEAGVVASNFQVGVEVTY